MTAIHVGSARSLQIGFSAAPLTTTFPHNDRSTIDRRRHGVRTQLHRDRIARSFEPATGRPDAARAMAHRLPHGQPPCGCTSARAFRRR